MENMTVASLHLIRPKALWQFRLGEAKEVGCSFWEVVCQPRTSFNSSCSSPAISHTDRNTDTHARARRAGWSSSTSDLRGLERRSHNTLADKTRDLLDLFLSLPCSFFCLPCSFSLFLSAVCRGQELPWVAPRPRSEVSFCKAFFSLASISLHSQECSRTLWSEETWSQKASLNLLCLVKGSDIQSSCMTVKL